MFTHSRCRAVPVDLPAELERPHHDVENGRRVLNQIMAERRRQLGRNITKEAPQEEREEIFLAVVEARLNVLQRHRELILGHPLPLN